MADVFIASLREEKHKSKNPNTSVVNDMSSNKTSFYPFKPARKNGYIKEINMSLKIRENTLPERDTGSPLDKENDLCETLRVMCVYNIKHPENVPEDNLSLAMDYIKKVGVHIDNKWSQL